MGPRLIAATAISNPASGDVAAAASINQSRVIAPTN
jgi:hypothetical protein